MTRQLSVMGKVLRSNFALLASWSGCVGFKGRRTPRDRGVGMEKGGKGAVG